MPISDSDQYATAEALRAAVNDVANQLCGAVDGSFDLTISTFSEDETVQKLAALANFVVQSARHAVAEITDREARLQAIVETATEGIVTIDQKGTIESINSAAATMFGYQPGDVVGANVSVLMPEPYAAKHNEYLARYLRSGEGNVIGRSRELEGKRRDGTTFPLEIAVSEIRQDGQRVFTAILRDLSEQRQLQCELSQAQKLESVGQLAAGIAHEINTPTQYVGDNTQFLKDAFLEITAVLDSYGKLLEIAKDGTVGEQVVVEVEDAVKQADIQYLVEEIPQAIDQSLDGIDRVAKIVRAMKEFSHPGSEEKNLINLRHAIETTITVSRNEWKYVAEVVTDFASDLPDVPCLPGELNQVLLNLIVNAAHAIGNVVGDCSNDKGKITVSTRREDRWAVICVADTGTGVPEKIRSRIFDPFFTTKEVGKGTGQGLAIARSVVVDKHGGTIDCETEEGKGSTFTVRLPIPDEN